MRLRVPFALAGLLALAGPALVWCPVPDARAQQPKKIPPAKKDPAAATFGPDKVWQIHLSMTTAEYDAMQPAQGGFGFPGGPPPKVEPKKADGMRETHRSVFGTDFPLAVAALTVDGKTVEKVGIRYKGNSTYLTTARNLKRSFKLDIDKYDDEARILGQKTINLHCGVLDPSKGREALAYSIYRAAGVPAPRTAFAEVTLSVPGKYDKEFVGLYVLVENIDKGFLNRHYGNDKGLLMKPERIRGLDYLGDDWSRYLNTYQPKRDATKEESKRVIDFTKLVNQGTDAQFDKEISSYLDIDAFLRFMAATALISNLDSFFTIGHNYCLYLHPETNKFHFIPWDVDLSLGNFAWFGTADQQMDLSLTKPYAQNRLADRLMANKDIAARYQVILKEVVAAAFDTKKLLAEVAVIEKTVKPLIEKEQKAVSARKEPAGGFGPGLGAAPPDLTRFVEKRSESIAAQMAGKSKGYSPTGFGFAAPPARPLPGDVLPPNVQTQLQMTDSQKRQLADLQKLVDAELEKILTPAQRAQLKQLRDGAGGIPPKKP